MTDPLRLVFGIHLHQPVGNFDHVFEAHVRDVYRPLLTHTAAAGFFPLTLHVSGPLLEWLDEHEPAFLDSVARLVSDGKIEMLLAGFDEPILAAVPIVDRLEQIARMREYLERRFGAKPSGLWLTERVWEPGLAADLADAGVGYALVDDRHFVVCGFRRDQLHQPWRTESDGKAVTLLTIDERMRYLIPFRPPEETAAYLRQLKRFGHGLAVFADDGEKFGGWPGTREWVYDKGWLNQFLGVIGAMRDAGEIRMVTGSEAAREVPSGGLAYLPTASYREMETWSLPPQAQTRLLELEGDLGKETLEKVEGVVRGGHWHNFLVKYAESNRMHKTMVALSALSRWKGDPPLARRALGRAQCNDAYWHGVFGGLYLPHLRNAIWRQLAIAERELRRDEGVAWETRDVDIDGHDELWVHGPAFSALVSPRRGGAVETFVRFADEVNLADVLTRRREAYHEAAVAAAAAHAASGGEGDGTASIHDIEKNQRLGELPPADIDVRAILVDRMLSGDLAEHAYARASYAPVVSWSSVPMAVKATLHEGAAVITLTGEGLEKTLTFRADGSLRAAWRWDPDVFPDTAVFAPELSLARDVALVTEPAVDVWRYDITTVGKSERGLEHTKQGVALTPRWPARLGAAALEIPAPDGTGTGA